MATPTTRKEGRRFLPRAEAQGLRAAFLMTDDQTQRSWTSTPTVEELNALGKGFLFDALGMRVEEASAERVVMSMPVTQTTQQPVGILHGGATVALAESAASIGTWLGIDRTAFSTL